MSKCPCCHTPLSKRKQRDLTPLEWQKVQVAYWMDSWHAEYDRRVELEKKLNRRNTTTKGRKK